MPSTSTCRSSRRLDFPIDTRHGYLEPRKKIRGHVPNQGQGYEARGYASKSPFCPRISLSCQCQDSSRKPDIVLPRYKTVIFVHGCFWHGHPGCKYAYTPKSNTEFWVNKISGNQERDAVVKRELEEFGWKVIIVWECEIRHGKDFAGLIDKLSADIRTQKSCKYSNK